MNAAAAAGKRRNPPLLPDRLICDAYEKAAERNVMAAVNPRILSRLLFGLSGRSRFLVGSNGRREVEPVTFAAFNVATHVIERFTLQDPHTAV